MYLAMNRGDSWNEIFVVLDDGEPYDLSAVTRIRATVKNAPDDADSAALLRHSSDTSGIVILTQSGDTLGQFQWSITPAETKTLVTADYRCVFDIQLTLSDGSVHTPFLGEFFIAGDITHNSGTIGTDV